MNKGTKTQEKQLVGGKQQNLRYKNIFGWIY